MRVPVLSVAPAVLVTLAACGSDPSLARPAPAPAAVSCLDAPQLRQRGNDDRRHSVERKSDQEKIYIGNRANFYASLAIIADLKCKVPLAGVDDALKPALEAARKAETTRSLYEMAQRWGEAAFIAAQVVALQVQQLPAPPPK